MSREEEIRQIIAMSPGDPFPRYGLAMEYKNAGKHAEACAAFAELQGTHPDYVPQYLMHGNLLVELKRHAQAREVFARGIEAARRARNAHALNELQAAADALADADDD